MPLEILLNRIIRQTEQNPDFIVGHFLDWLDDQGKPSQLTRQEWVTKAKQIGFALKEKGVQPGDRVILSLPTSPNFFISFLALWWIGAIPVPLPEASPFIKKGNLYERLIHVIQDCSPRGIIVLDFGKEVLLKIEEIKSLLASAPLWTWEELLEDGTDQTTFNSHPTSEDQIAFIQYTSGSTGNPKGVIVTYKNLYANLQAIGEASQASAEKDRYLSWLPLYHDLGLVGSVFWTTHWEVPSYLMSPYTFLSSPSAWLESISKYKATISPAPNFAFNLCARRVNPERISKLDLSSWRLAINGAEPIDFESFNSFTEKFTPYGFSKKTPFPVFGMAEAVLAISFPPLDSGIQIDRIKRKDLNEQGTATPANEDEKDAIAVVCLGSALPKHQIKIKDPNSDKILDERKIGEVCFYGPSVTPGYFSKSSNEPPRKELRSGDLGYIAGGNLYVVDRIKDVIQIAGVNYYPTDIEKQVQTIEGIRSGRVVSFGLLDPKTGTSNLIVVAEFKEGFDLGNLRENIRKKILQVFGTSIHDIFLSNDKIIPITSSGKVTRKKCRDNYLEMKIEYASSKQLTKL